MRTEEESARNGTSCEKMTVARIRETCNEHLLVGFRSCFCLLLSRVSFHIPSDWFPLPGNSVYIAVAPHVRRYVYLHARINQSDVSRCVLNFKQ